MPIETIEINDMGVYSINAYADGDPFVFLTEDLNGDYRTGDGNDDVWITPAVIECPVTDSLLFPDYIDDQSGSPLELPVVHTAQELTARLPEEDATEVYTVGLICNNAYVVFDGKGQLASIHRFLCSVAIIQSPNKM